MIRKIEKITTLVYLENEEGKRKEREREREGGGREKENCHYCSLVCGVGVSDNFLSKVWPHFWWQVLVC